MLVFFLSVYAFSGQQHQEHILTHLKGEKYHHVSGFEDKTGETWAQTFFKSFNTCSSMPSSANRSRTPSITSSITDRYSFGYTKAIVRSFDSQIRMHLPLKTCRWGLERLGCCPWGGPGLDSQHPCQLGHNCLSLQPQENLPLLLVSWSCMHVHIPHADLHIYTHN